MLWLVQEVKNWPHQLRMDAHVDQQTPFSFVNCQV
jgi:hypothetical protein